VYQISDLRREADQICALLDYQAAKSVNSLLDVSGQPIGPNFKNQEIQDLLNHKLTETSARN